MVLTKPELVASLQKEVHILLHLAGKIDRTQLDYRPTPKQRSTQELVQYLSMMGPFLVQAGKAGAFDPAAWTAAEAETRRRDIDQTIAAIAAQADEYETLLADVSEADFRAEVTMFGHTSSLGGFLVNSVLAGCAAYRTQLFLYLKVCGQPELGTTNLWAGVDAPVATV